MNPAELASISDGISNIPCGIISSMNISVCPFVQYIDAKYPISSAFVIIAIIPSIPSRNDPMNIVSVACMLFRYSEFVVSCTCPVWILSWNVFTTGVMYACM